MTGERLPVRRADVVARLREAGDRRAARIVDRMPATGEFLDPAAVDLLLVRVHTELQRLNEELHMAQRFAEILLPMITAVRTSRIIPRVVDIGCGLGFLVRSLAATGVLGDDVELVGVDFNPTLIAEATRLAADEHLRCTFARADAFTLAEPATVYLSSGVLHHFPADMLPEFFQAQDRAGAQGFIHYDIAATRLAPLGAWLFHQARMREPLGRHDGVMSARRAHSDSVLLSAAAAADGMDTFLFEPMLHTNPFCAAMRPVIGLRPTLVDDFRRALGRRARALAATSTTVD